MTDHSEQYAEADTVIRIMSRWASKRLGVAYEDAYQDGWVAVLTYCQSTDSLDAALLSRQIKSHLLDRWYKELGEKGIYRGRRNRFRLLYNPLDREMQSIETIVHNRLLLEKLRVYVWPKLKPQHKLLIEQSTVLGIYWQTEYAQKLDVNISNIHSQVCYVRERIHTELNRVMKRKRLCVTR